MPDCRHEFVKRGLAASCDWPAALRRRCLVIASDFFPFFLLRNFLGEGSSISLTFLTFWKNFEKLSFSSLRRSYWIWLTSTVKQKWHLRQIPRRWWVSSWRRWIRSVFSQGDIERCIDLDYSNLDLWFYFGLLGYCKLHTATKPRKKHKKRTWDIILKCCEAVIEIRASSQRRISNGECWIC